MNFEKLNPYYQTFPVIKKKNIVRDIYNSSKDLPYFLYGINKKEPVDNYILKNQDFYIIDIENTQIKFKLKNDNTIGYIPVIYQNYINLRS